MSPSGTFRPYIGLVGGRTLIQQPVEGLKDVDHQARAELLAAVHRRRVVFHVTVRGREDRRRPSCFGICWRPSRPGGEWWPAATRRLRPGKRLHAAAAGLWAPDACAHTFKKRRGSQSFKQISRNDLTFARERSGRSLPQFLSRAAVPTVAVARESFAFLSPSSIATAPAVPPTSARSRSLASFRKGS